jgi:serine/threonine protein kinase
MTPKPPQSDGPASGDKASLSTERLASLANADASETLGKKSSVASLQRLSPSVLASALESLPSRGALSASAATLAASAPAISSATPPESPPATASPGLSTTLADFQSKTQNLALDAADTAEAQTRLSFSGDFGIVDSDHPTIRRGFQLSPSSAGIDASEDYILLRKIGEGGMGEVWEAWQASLSRLVAVKRLKGSAPEQIVEFLQEAYTAGELDHPNIAPAYDLGRVMEDSVEKPLLAMQLARGVSWREMIRDDHAAENFVLEDFLAKHLPILVDVCDAVAYAHHKEIIHRDLKPAQVMVGEFGEVRLMDWGLALSLREEAPLAARDGLPKHQTLESASNPCGSPAYMAPEQTQETAAGLGRHTDIYLLGATLFELVASKPPHHAGAAREAFFMAMLNERHETPESCPPELAALIDSALRSDPAERPASAIEFRDVLKDYLTGSGKRRESRELTRDILHRLDTLPQTYSEIADEFSRLQRARSLWPDNPDLPDLRQRLLGGYSKAALEAGDLAVARFQAQRMNESPERDALLGKVAAVSQAAANRERQRWMAVRLSLALAGLLVASAAGFCALIYFNNQELERERDAARQASFDAERARQQAERSREQASAARGESDELARFMLADLRDRLKKADQIELLDEAARRALESFRRQATRDDLDPKETYRVGQSLRLVGRIFLAQGDTAGAQEAFGLMLSISQRLERQTPGGEPARELLALARRGSGRVHLARGQSSEAFQDWTEASALFRELVQRAPETWLADLAETTLLASNAALALGRDDDAKALLGESLEAARRLAKTAGNADAGRFMEGGALVSLAAIALRQGNWSEAQDLYGQALDIYRALVAQAPEDDAYQAQLALTLSALGYMTDPGAALERYQEALEIFRDLRRRDPSDMDNRQNLALGLSRTGDALFWLNRLEEAFSVYEEALEEARWLAGRDPESADWARQFSLAWEKTGNALLRLNRFEEALERYSEALALTRELVATDSENLMWRMDLALGHNKVGDTLDDSGRHKEALASYRESQAIIQGLREVDPDNPELLRASASGEERLGHAFLKLDRFDEAEESAQKALAARRELVAQNPDNPEERSGVIFALLLLGHIEHGRGSFEKALSFYEASLAEAQAFQELAPNSPEPARRVRHAREASARVLLKMGRVEEARAIMRELLAQGPFADSRLNALAREQGLEAPSEEASPPPNGATPSDSAELQPANPSSAP